MRVNRIIIAGTNSGSGKTTVTCGIMRALGKRGIKVSPFKCGPDYIDPMFHEAVAGQPGGNLDTFLFDENAARYLLAKNAQGSDTAVIEGVMGYYDGIGPNGTDASTYDVARVTDTPVVLVVNCKGLSTSALAIIKGFIDYRNDSNIKGVILNNISQYVYERLKIQIENELNVSVLGFLPKLPADCVFESRYLGLVTPPEHDGIMEKLDALADIVRDSIDLDALIKTACLATDITYEKPLIKHSDRVKIAVGSDEAFCFHYRDNLDLLREIGVEFEFFSPLADKRLPEGVSGLILYGGYPELYLDELLKNKTLMNDIHSKLSDGLPCIAECGGFMYLNRSINGVKMVGFLDSDCYKTDKLGRFGYINMTARKDNLLCIAGESITAHEFHYFDCGEPGRDFTAKKPDGREWPCAVATDTLYAGFPHIHFYGNLRFAQNFIEKCAAYANGKERDS